jgi:hypothetical protein
MDYGKKVCQGHLLTSSGETADSWALRETSASLDFFDRLVLRVTGTFLTEALVAFGDFTAGSISCTEGSSATTSSAEGGAAVSLFGSSSSLKSNTENRFLQPKRKKANTVKPQNSKKTYDAMKSKSSSSSS